MPQPKLVYYKDRDMQIPVPTEKLLIEEERAGQTVSKYRWVRNEGDADLRRIAVEHLVPDTLRIIGFPKSLTVQQSKRFRIIVDVPEDAEDDIHPSFEVYGEYLVTRIV